MQDISDNTYDIERDSPPQKDGGQTEYFSEKNKRRGYRVV